MVFKVPESNRVAVPKSHPAYDTANGNNGYFNLVYVDKKTQRKTKLFVVASDGLGWNHVSVSIVIKKIKRCPTWEMMCFVKSIFWSPEDTVIQYHPPEKDYVSFHDYCLHMWESQNQTIPAPDSLMVAPKGYENK